jgi:mono/diheme cytochrome c family protein
MRPRILFAFALALPGLAGVAHADVDRTFRAKCGGCHGPTGNGETEQGKKMKVGDMTRRTWQKQFSDAEMKGAISDGFKRDKDGITQEMKGFKDRLKPDEIDALIAYVRALAK